MRERRVRRRFDDDLHRTRAGGDRHRRTPRVDALQRLAVWSTHEALALESGAVSGEAEIDDRLDPPRRPLGGHLGPAAEPRRAPRRSPRRRHGERVAGHRATARPRRSSPAGRGWTSGQHAFEQLAVDALLDQAPVVVHRWNGSDTEISLTDTMSRALAGPPPAFGQLAMRHRLTLVVAGAGWGKSAMLRGLTADRPEHRGAPAGIRLDAVRPRPRPRRRHRRRTPTTPSPTIYRPTRPPNRRIAATRSPPWRRTCAPSPRPPSTATR